MRGASLLFPQYRTCVLWPDPYHSNGKSYGQRSTLFFQQTWPQLGEPVRGAILALLEECVRISALPGEAALHIPALKASSDGRLLLTLRGPDAIGTAVTLFEVLNIRNLRSTFGLVDRNQDGVLMRVLNALLKADLPWTDDDLARLLALTTDDFIVPWHFSRPPAGSVMGVIERVHASRGLGPHTRAEIGKLLAYAEGAAPNDKPSRAIHYRLDQLRQALPHTLVPAATASVQASNDNTNPGAMPMARTTNARELTDAEKNIARLENAVQRILQAKGLIPTSVAGPLQGLFASRKPDLKSEIAQLVASIPEKSVGAVLVFGVKEYAHWYQAQMEDMLFSIGAGDPDLPDDTWGEILKRLFARKPAISEGEMADILDAASSMQSFTLDTRMPLQPLLQVMKRQLGEAKAGPRLTSAIEDYIPQLHKKDRAEEIAILKSFIAAAPAAKFDFPRDMWGHAIKSAFDKQPEPVQDKLVPMLVHARTAKGATPARKWLDAADKLFDAKTRDACGAFLADCAGKLDPNVLIASRPAPANAREKYDLERRAWALPSHHGDFARGLLRLAALSGAKDAGRGIEAVAVAMSQLWTEGYGAGVVVFNGAVQALSLIPGTAGAAHLTNLKRKMKRPSEQTQIDKALNALATRAGSSVAALEEQSVPDFGLSAAGELEIESCTVRARIAISGASEAAITWLDGKGHALTSSPKPKTDAEKAAIADVKKRVKEIGDTLKAHAARLERFYLTTQSWPLAAWQSVYLSHPILAHLANALVWSFESDGETTSGMPRAGGRIVDAEGKALKIAKNATVRLWHPMMTTPKDITAWRRFVIAQGITQPIKQVYREVYVLTDAERTTNTYSNRFAANILRQAQYRALGKARGWRIPLEGYWDGAGDGARRALPDLGLTAHYITMGVDGDIAGDGGACGIYNLVTTDRVCFYGAGNAAVALETVPPMVFSEIMRDADLFTAVAGLGNDPNWQDLGPEHPLQVYYARCNAEIHARTSEMAKVRREVLADLLPHLSIAAQCTLNKNTITVKGKRASYTIQISSGAVHIAGSGHVCIVPSARGQEIVRLPFEGDGTLSLILSKAFLLAEDDKITDPVILKQLDRVTV